MNGYEGAYMGNKLKELFFYAGVDKESYERVITDIDKSNRNIVIIFSALASAFVGIMCIITFFVDSTIQNRRVYFVGFILSIILLSLSKIYAKKNSWIIVPLVHFAFSIFFIYGIVIGTITNPSQQTVTFMVMLVFLPVLFNEIPIRAILNMVFYIAIFIFLCFKNKTGAVLSTDLMDAIIYGILGAVSGAIINHIKVRSYVLEHKLHDASRFDQLTQLNNRNSFENDLQQLPSRCSENLVCIYIDVNGLHELNNSQGHQMGDIMLQFIAEKVREFFGDKYTYRIGGDEFVIFAMDSDEDTLRARLLRLTEVIEKENYHVAVGYSILGKEKIDMDTLIKEAESEMYRSKSQYYMKHGRRSR